jgi:hypothetical protein
MSAEIATYLKCLSNSLLALYRPVVDPTGDNLAATATEASRLVGWSTVAVAIGVAFELFEPIHDAIAWIKRIRHNQRERAQLVELSEFTPVNAKAGSKKSHATSDHPTWVRVFGRIGIVLVVLGVVGEWRYSGQLEDAHNAIHERDLGIIGETEKAASDAIVRADKLDKEAEDERLARVKIEATVAFRSFDEQQKRDIGRKLSRFGNVTGVSIWFAAGTPEAELFADDIADALRFAHIHVRPPGGILTARQGGGPWDTPVVRADTGVVIVPTTNPLAHELADSIVKEFSSMGFDTTRGPDEPSKDNKPPGAVVWVTVHARPKGPQGEFKLQAEREVKANNKRIQNNPTAEP